MPLRIYLTGRLDVELDGALLDLRRLPGRQGRRALACLVCERAHPMAREALAKAVWAVEPPVGWDGALSAVVSKLRALLAVTGARVESAFGSYQLQLPPDAWVDVEAAARAVDEAEGALRDGDALRAWGPAGVAVTITSRPFLPGEEGAWVERQRARLRALRVRALDCMAESRLANGEGALAVEAAAETIALEPFRESGYRRLMRAHAALGDRAQALRVYERLRRLLADELGADPSPETETLYLSLLGAP